MTRVNASNEGVYVYGLYLDGAIVTKIIICEIPIINLFKDHRTIYIAEDKFYFLSY